MATTIDLSDIHNSVDNQSNGTFDRHAVYQVDSGEVGLHPGGPEVALSSLKPSIKDKVTRLHRRVQSDTIFSAATNLLVYALIVAILVILPATATRHLSTEELVALVIIACISIPMYGFFCVREGYRRRSVIGHVLRHQTSQEELNKVLFDRVQSAPSVSFKISLKRGAVSKEAADHWTRREGHINHNVDYTSWEDRSKSVRDLPWPEGRCAWIIVAKDFATRNKQTDQSVAQEIITFKKGASYDSYIYYMEADYELQYKDLSPVSDWELYFVYSRQAPRWANLTLYRICCFCAVDIFYRIFFHCRAKYMDEFNVVKVIER